MIKKMQYRVRQKIHKRKMREICNELRTLPPMSIFNGGIDYQNAKDEFEKLKC